MKNRRIDRRICLEKKMDASITYTDTLNYIAGCCVCDVSSRSMFLESETPHLESAHALMSYSLRFTKFL